jgi:PAS domain-containing protein
MIGVGETAREAWFPVGEAEQLTWLCSACEQHLPVDALQAHKFLRDQVASSAVPQSGAGLFEEVFLNQDAFLFEQLRLSASGNFAVCERSLRELGGRWSRANVQLGLWYETAAHFRRASVKALLSAYACEANRLEGSLCALGRFLDRAAAVITEEYLAERERVLQEQRQQTEQAARRFSRLFESGLLGILVCDFEGRAKEANDSFLNLVGYTREEMQAGQMNWAEMTPPEWREFDHVAIEQLKLHGRTNAWE